jgi:hypothetical protein
MGALCKNMYSGEPSHEEPPRRGTTNEWAAKIAACYRSHQVSAQDDGGARRTLSQVAVSGPRLKFRV